MSSVLQVRQGRIGDGANVILWPVGPSDCLFFKTTGASLHI